MSASPEQKPTVEKNDRAKGRAPAGRDELYDLLRGLLACCRQGARRADVGLPELPSGGKVPAGRVRVFWVFLQRERYLQVG